MVIRCSFWCISLYFDFSLLLENSEKNNTPSFNFDSF